MLTPDFAQVTTWVFDLDNTLYPPSMRLFDQIEVKMTDWVMQALQVDRARADHLRAHYWQTYGTTLAGLMTEHGVDPGPYLTEVHDIDFSILAPDPGLAEAIAALPGRKIIYTNACVPYAQKVVAARGLEGLFDAVYGVEEAAFHPKPEARAFATVFARDGLDPTRAAMFEDDARNLSVPHALGMRTVHVAPEARPEPHIHHHTSDLAGFLTGLANRRPMGF
jgi:putative hydrolase of the HAD superfamily